MVCPGFGFDRCLYRISLVRVSGVSFNEELVELVNGDLEVVVKVVEVQKDVQDVVVVGAVAVDPPVGAAGRLGVRRRRKRAR